MGSTASLPAPNPTVNRLEETFIRTQAGQQLLEEANTRFAENAQQAFEAGKHLLIATAQLSSGLFIPAAWSTLQAVNILLRPDRR